MLLRYRTTNDAQAAVQPQRMQLTAIALNKVSAARPKCRVLLTSIKVRSKSYPLINDSSTVQTTSIVDVPPGTKPLQNGTITFRYLNQTLAWYYGWHCSLNLLQEPFQPPSDGSVYPGKKFQHGLTTPLFQMSASAHGKLTFATRPQKNVGDR